MTHRPGTWDQADLVARLCDSLDVASAVVERFASEGYTDAESPGSSLAPEKVQAETAMLLYAASRAGHSPLISARLRAVAEQLVAHVRSERTLLKLVLHPSRALTLGLAHVLLSGIGYCDERWDAMITACLRSQAADGRERAPVEALEERWVASLLAGAQAPPAGRGDQYRSIASRRLDLLGGTREDGYAFTHVLMYATDFGTHSAWQSRTRSRLIASASSLLATSLAADDLDLAGEALMAWPLTGATWSPGAIFGWRVLAGTQDRLGTLPSGTTSATRLDRLEGEARAQYLLATTYHPAYVMGLLCATALLPDRAPPAELWGGPRGDAAFADHLWERARSQPRLWQCDVARLQLAERRVLAPFLLDFVIAQQCRSRDYDGLSRLLSEALRHGLARSALCSQAAELLERLAGFAAAHPVERAAHVARHSTIGGGPRVRASGGDGHTAHPVNGTVRRSRVPALQEVQ